MGTGIPGQAQASPRPRAEDARIEPQILYLVVPCYNEEKVLPESAGLFLGELRGLIEAGRVSPDSRILFVDDGSADGTWREITKLHQADRHVSGLKLSRNRGHQNALLAGLMEAGAYADFAISMDCDGQDDIHAIGQMAELYQEGYDIVYGVRKDRQKDSFFKRVTAEAYYRLLESMGAAVVFNHADFRLLSRRVLEELGGFKEVNLFLRGMIPLIGFESACVYYERQERMAGESHYSLKKMLQLALEGITSLSIRPLQIISVLGYGIAFFSFIGILWAIADRLLGHTAWGWASLVCIFCFFSGVQLICLGILGEYLGKIYLEVKARPRYIISERLGLTPLRHPKESTGSAGSPLDIS